MNDPFELKLSKENYENNYKFGDDKNIYDSWYRTAKALAQPEDNSEYWTEEFYSILGGYHNQKGYPAFSFSPGGRITANAGTKLGKATLINCFVSGFQGEDRDSMDEIQSELRRQAKILCSEGGYGFCCSVIRPRGSRIGGVGSLTPGAVQMLDMWDWQARTVVAGAGVKSERDDVKDKIRKGAQMVTMHCWHPDIKEFITAKHEQGRLEKFNMSVLCSNEFMEAVKNDKEWKLVFPDYENEKEFYKKNWEGKIDEYVAKGGSVKVHETLPARELWNMIMDSTYNHNEPGVIFVDRVNYWNNLSYEEYICATNPCGEQLLPTGGVCLLGNLTVPKFLKDDWSGFDWNLMEEVVPKAVRFLDNVNDITFVPLEEQEWNLQAKRRIGLGHMGFGSALMMMKVRYGSEEAVQLANRFQYRLANQAYQASAKLAKEKEPFPLFDRDEYLSSPFVKKLSEDTQEMIAEYGLRNSHLLSCQPTGNTSTVANNVEGGIEPVFMAEYYRSSEQPYAPEGLDLPDSIDWKNKVYTIQGTQIGIRDSEGKLVNSPVTKWEFIEEGKNTLLKTEFEGKTWKISQNRGLVREDLVDDYGVRRLKEKGEWDPEADWAATTRDLDAQDHVDMMEAFMDYIDSAGSKTINVPKDYSFEDFKDLYMNMWETGVIKGGTTFREGTMEQVLSSATEKSDDLPSERPDTLPCVVEETNYNGETWYIIIGQYNDSPYELFAAKRNGSYIKSSIPSEGKVVKKDSGIYDLVDKSANTVIEDITSKTPNGEIRAMTRLISMTLRSPGPNDKLVEQLEKADPVISNFARSAEKALKKHTDFMEECPECGAGPESLSYQESCVECKNCGHSKC